MRKFSANKLVIATHNAGKLSELQELLGPYVKDVVSAGQLGLPEPEETGTTFEENALIKAQAAAKATGAVALADDSGLCVNALNGQPGLHSARWGGPEKDFMTAMRRVNDELNSLAMNSPSPLEGEVRRGVCKGAPSPAKTKSLLRKLKFLLPLPQGERDSNIDRSACFICVLVLAWPDGHHEVIEGRCDGTIVWPPRGDKGHGYDPVFQPQGYDKTFAEMDSEQKNILSHRGKALRQLVETCFKK